jgi:hypothetical protein
MMNEQQNSTQSVENVNPLLKSISIEGQQYFTSQRLHADYLRNGAEQGITTKYHRHHDYLRIIRSIPNYSILVENADVVIADKKQLRTSNDALKQTLLSLLEPLFRANDHKRLILLNATAQLELTHHLDDLLNQEIAYRHSHQTAESLVDGFLRRHGFTKYESLYDMQIVREFCRVWGVKEPKDDGSGQHWPGVGKLFKQFIYGIFPPEVQDAIEQRRHKYIHLVFRDDRRQDTLLKRVEQVMPLLRICDEGEKDTFIALLERHDRRIGLEVQLAAKIRVRLSTIATNQLLLWDTTAVGE